MRASATVRGTFAASHTIPGHPVCGRDHGHTWEVSVTVEAPVSPKTGSVVDTASLSVALATVVAELGHRNLDVMLPGVVSTPEGLAMWVRERLLLAYPNITCVTVSNGDYTASVTWELR